MIEKIIRAVKSNNKKRGRNITIGAVVGMLLSCTTIMGKDVVGLEITKDGDKIIFRDKDGASFIPGKEESPNKDPHPNNKWDGNTYINNSTISGEATTSGDKGIGLKLSGDLGENFVLKNNGAIIGNGGYGYSYGICISNLEGKLTNNGAITGSESGSGLGYGYGISMGSLTGNLTNKGVIIGNGDYGYGIYIASSLIGNLTNKGIITGSSDSSGSGIYIKSSLTGNLTNNGTIRGSSNDEGSGIYIYSSLTGNLTNTGVIYGTDNAIKIYTNTANSAYNCGLLVSGKSEKDTVSGVTSLTDSNNLGLIFKDISGKYTVTDDDFAKFGTTTVNADVVVGIDESSKPITKVYTIINAKAKGTSDNIIGTESILSSELSENKKYVLNGITDTLKVDKNILLHQLNDSVINAYKTAVVMEGESNLTLENTVVNGGIDGEYDSTTEEYINYSPAISVKGDNNFLTIKGDSIVNGDIKATGDKNTLNLYGKQNMTRSSDSKSMDILHNIEGFGRIQIENNVTFFENAKVTGVDRLNINNGGTLSLRLKKDGAKATHALSVENTRLLIAGKEEEGSENAGTLNFITNGMGTGTVIDMGGIKLENVYLRANSIVYMMEVVEKTDADANVGDIRLDVGTSLADIYNERKITSDPYSDADTPLLPDETLYNSLNKIYQSSVKDDDNVNAVTDMIDSTSGNEQWEKLLTFLGGVYTESPYSFSSELSKKSVGMFRDIVAENEFRPNLNNWLIMGGFTHTDGGTKDTYYGKNYYKIDGGTSTTDADMKLTGAYMLAKYGYSENTSLGLTLGGNKSEAKMDISKVKGNSGYLGAFAENYRGNLILKAGAGVQYSEYDADRRTIGGHSYNDKYSDMTYDIYLNGRYSNPIGENLFLEPYATLSYTYVDQEGANEGGKALAIEIDSKSFDYTVGKVGVDLKKVILHEKGKSTLTAGVSYTKILDGADEEYITGRFKGGSDFDILVAHKNEHSIGLNAKYALELENGVLFDVKGTYSIERDSHNGSGKNKTKGEWIVGAGMGYKF
ncbi:autotransporter family protein [Fusobacterium ulcerans]|uniref:autotransporter family protein n=1 Tax=Fusobacterium ulcerans TaxID=861 RepID=UPI0036F21EDC